MDQVGIVRSAAKKLSEVTSSQSVFIGFDGFVDEIIHLVSERQDADRFTRIETISAFAERVQQAAGKSTNIELVVKQIKLGGNGPIMANALDSQGYSIIYCGALGKDRIHPVFEELVSRCKKVVSFADPGHTDALEFFDGKVMMGKLQSIRDVHWKGLMQKISPQELLPLLSEVSLLAFVNWTMLTSSETIYTELTNLLGTIPQRKTVWVDLADPRKRTQTDIRSVIKLLGTMQSTADIFLGLNEEESDQIANVLGISSAENIQVRADKIRKAAGVHMVIIHPVRSAAVATAAGTFGLTGPYTSTPQLTTGAGDNFNAGFCNGFLAGLSPAECLACGVGTSGFYVRNCRSPKRSELAQFMQSWAEVNCGDI
ncbi:MAG: hypothetical protein KGJ59_05070 [Bacteroidota bacterium]|nr:hypothetical protein [Bacteroidota bacterium]